LSILDISIVSPRRSPSPSHCCAMGPSLSPLARGEGKCEAHPMIARARSRFFAHIILILGLIVVAFPIYYVFVASTHPLETILKPPLPLLPGDRFLANYGEALFGGVGRIGGVGVGTLLFNSTLVAL